MTGQQSALNPGILLRAEALATLILVCAFYQQASPGHWLFFALLFLFPDVSLLGFFSGPSRASAAFYNLLHTSILPLALGMLAWHQHWTVALRFSLVWLAHIAFDRVLGFGLKYPSSFKITHLQAAANPL